MAHIVDHALFQIADGEPVDIFAVHPAFVHAGVHPLAVLELGGAQAVAQQAAHDVVGKGFHAAVGVVNDEPFLRSQQLVGDDQ